MSKTKDLGVKIGTKREPWWVGTKRETEILIEHSENNIIIQKEIVKLADKMIAEEKEKFK